MTLQFTTQDSPWNKIAYRTCSVFLHGYFITVDVYPSRRYSLFGFGVFNSPPPHTPFSFHSNPFSFQSFEPQSVRRYITQFYNASPWGMFSTPAMQHCESSQSFNIVDLNWIQLVLSNLRLPLIHATGYCSSSGGGSLTVARWFCSSPTKWDHWLCNIMYMSKQWISSLNTEKWWRLHPTFKPALHDHPIAPYSTLKIEDAEQATCYSTHSSPSTCKWACQTARSQELHTGAVLRCWRGPKYFQHNVPLNYNFRQKCS